jgi:hypothetical protein
MKRTLFQNESTASNKQQDIFSDSNKTNSRRILNIAAESFPAAFISISTPANMIKICCRLEKTHHPQHYEGPTEKYVKGGW